MIQRFAIGAPSLVVFCALFGGVGHSYGEDGAAKPAGAPNVEIPEGYLLIEEDVWYQLADEPDIHFLQARRDYLRNQPVDAGAAVRKGTAILKLAAAHARGEAKKSLQASILELETLAMELEHGEVKSARSLDRIFCRSFFALASYNEDEARRHLKAEEPDKAARHLRSASRNVVHAAVWRGTELEDHFLRQLRTVEDAADLLVKEGRKGFASALKSLDEMHKYYEQLQEALKAAE